LLSKNHKELLHWQNMALVAIMVGLEAKLEMLKVCAV